MCGIFGILDGTAAGLDQGRARAALDLLAARGPDDAGWYTDSRIWLGHRRLTIMDVSATGHQPMSNEDGTLWLTFNGEIYRFRETRSELERLGHTFRSTSDTEVVLHGYEQWGAAVLDHIDGMFAFALWDSRTARLLLARDRLGKKPLFWTRRGSAIGFSSLMRPLVTSGLVEPIIDPAALRQFLFLNYVIGPRTIFHDVQLLPAGSWLKVHNGQIRSGRYWNLADFHEPATSDEPPQQRFEDLLVDATRARLVSDVPVGIFLSGGVDSAVVAALAQREAGRRQQTFSVGFAERSYDERSQAAASAARIGTLHHEIECSPQDVLELLPRIVASADHLLADQSLVPLCKLAGVTKQSVKVVLTGDGGDELLAGYATYRALGWARPYIERVPQPLRRIVARFATLLPAQSHKMATMTVLLRFLQATTSDLATAHASWRAIWTAEEIDSNSALGPEVTHPASDYARIFDQHPDWALLQRAVSADIGVWLVDSILAKVDRATMSYGLEARSPLLDSRLVRFAFSTLLPSVSSSANKAPLRAMAASLLGPEVAGLAKNPFQTPFATWFAGPLRPLVRDALDTIGRTFPGVFDDSRIAAIEIDHAAGRHNHDYKLWGLVTLAEWSKLYPGVRIGQDDSLGGGRRP